MAIALQRVPLLHCPSGMTGGRKEGVTKPLRLSHHGPNLGFGWMLCWHHWPQSPPALLGPPCTANIERINSKSVAVMCRGRAVLGCCGTLFYTHHYAPKQARGTLDPNTAQAATGTLLKVLKAVLGVGQEQLELRSLRKAESRDVSLWLLPTPNRSDICFISCAYLLF